MSADVSRHLSLELGVIERFATSYQEQFASLIRELNVSPTPGSAQKSLRLCVEAMNMMLASQKQLAASIRSMAAEVDGVLRPAA